MKIHILYDFKTEPWGGGNQFLSMLRGCLQRSDQYAESVRDADVILFNSHHKLDEVLHAKLEYPEKIFIHRMGSVFKYARGDKYLDKILIDVNHKIADGTIYQSEWQRRAYQELGMVQTSNKLVVPNAPDGRIFNTRENENKPNNKIRIITTGWSTGKIKGFDIYKFLDKHLDFTQYQLLFFGNSEVRFKNIDQFPVQSSRTIASMLRGSHMFITGTQYDACSNSLLEALHCGLPAVARSSGGHPELVKNAGVLFEGTQDVIEAIAKVSGNLEEYRNAIDLPDENYVVNEYYKFCENTYQQYIPKLYCNQDYKHHTLMMKRQKIEEYVRVMKQVGAQVIGGTILRGRVVHG